MICRLPVWPGMAAVAAKLSLSQDSTLPAATASVEAQDSVAKIRISARMVIKFTLEPNHLVETAAQLWNGHTCTAISLVEF